MKNKKSKGLITLLLVATMILSACSGSSSSPAATSSSSSAGSAAETEKTYKETMQIAVTQQAPSLDLHKNSSLIARQMCDGSIWEKLVTLNSKAEAVPELAKSFEFADESKTLTFKLRKDVKFHDGSMMTADDVVASMNRWLGGFSAAGKMVGDAKFEKVDDYTVKISAQSALTLLPAMIAGAAQPASITTAAACANEDSNGFMVDYIGSGPYKFVEWKKDQYVKMERFEDYVPYGKEGTEMDGWYGYKAAPSKYLQFNIVSDQVTEAVGLEAGQYDVIFNVGPDDYDRLSNNPNLVAEQAQQGTIAWVFNKKQGIASNQYFRTAVNTALDYDEIIAATYGPLYELGSCYMDAGQPFWNTDAGSENYNQKNPEKAKQILAENGYNGETFTILVSTLNKMDNMGIAMKAQLEKIGIPVELTIVDWATLTDYRKDPGKFDIYFTSFSEVPVPSLKLYFGPTYPGWSEDAKLQQLFSEMTAAPTLDEAKAKWVDLQDYSWEYLPLISPGHYMGMYAWQKGVTGINMFSGGPRFWNAGVLEA